MSQRKQTAVEILIGCITNRVIDAFDSGRVALAIVLIGGDDYAVVSWREDKGVEMLLEGSRAECNRHFAYLVAGWSFDQGVIEARRIVRKAFKNALQRCVKLGQVSAHTSRLVLEIPLNHWSLPTMSVLPEDYFQADVIGNFEPVHV